MGVESASTSPAAGIDVALMDAEVRTRDRVEPHSLADLVELHQARHVTMGYPTRWTRRASEGNGSPRNTPDAHQVVSRALPKSFLLE